MAVREDMQAHLDRGLTTLCRAWSVTRRDGQVFGFTDHDCALTFDGLTFRADTGVTAMALQQSTGLSVDNTEALGALRSEALNEDDILAGRFDGAEVRAWIVNWAKPEEREIVFRGSIGELTRVDGAFRAEVRGLSDGLNQPFGRVIQRLCPAVLGDTTCAFDLDTPGYVYEGPITALDGRAAFEIDTDGAFADGWFQHGACQIIDGAAHGLRGVIKRDQLTGSGRGRRVELWEPMRAALAVGDRVRVVAGCDKRFETCRLKFDNLLNYQGFPDVPEDDWVISAASTSRQKSGGSRR